jgi:hypothetical protein
MIIEHNFADDLLEEIDFQLNQCQENGEIHKASSQLKNLKYKYIHNKNEFCLPLVTRNSTNLILLEKFYFQIYFNAIKEEHPTLIKDGIENTINKKFKESDASDDISSAIRDKVYSLVFDYNKVLSVTRKVDNLFGINDEEKILINHLNKYNELLKTDIYQLDFFHGIVLNKSISDLLTRIYVRFINLRLAILNPTKPEEDTSSLIKPYIFHKLVWNGNQNQLCELIIELQEKGWIEKIKPGALRKTCKTITTLFDLTKTQIKQDSNIEDSFYQIMKGEKNVDTGERNYDNILTGNYVRKFNQIKNKG